MFYFCPEIFKLSSNVKLKLNNNIWKKLRFHYFN